MDLLKHKKAICYPGMEDGMTLATVVHQNCCVDGKIITGRALGGAMDFALALCTAIMGVQRLNRLLILFVMCQQNKKLLRKKMKEQRNALSVYIRKANDEKIAENIIKSSIFKMLNLFFAIAHFIAK